MSLSRLIRSTLAVLALFFCIQGFNVLLSASTLDSQTTSSVLSGYRSVSTQLGNTIERGLRFGKPLDGFAGMRDHLRNTSDAVGGIQQIVVLDKDGAPLHRSTDDPVDIAERAFADYAPRQALTSRPEWVELPEAYVDVHPLHGYGGAVEGYLLTLVKRTVIESARNEFLRISFIIVASLAVAVGIAQTGWLAFIAVSAPGLDSDRLRKSIRWLLLIIIGGAQLLYSIPTLTFFEERIDISAEYKARVVGAPFARDLEFLIRKNVDFTKIKGIETELAALTEDNPEISGARLEYGGETIAGYGEQREHGGLVSIPVYESWPNRYTPRRAAGRLVMVQDRDFVNQRLRRLALDLGTTLVICLILLGELANLFAMFAGFDVRGRREAAVGQRKTTRLLDKTLLVRAMCFLFFFGYDMVLTFIPLAARDLGGSFLGLSASVLSSLPISAEMTLAGVGILLVGTFARTMPWHRLFLGGIVCAAAGGLLAASAPSIAMLILARAVAGLGFGLTLMSGQLGLLNQGNRAEGLGNMFAGIFAGSLCGCAVGAMLAEHFSYQTVFLASGLLIPLALSLLPFTSRAEPEAEAGRAPDAPAHAAGLQVAPLLAFLRQPRLWALLALVSLPAASCLSGFLYFIVPVRMEGLGVTQGDVGRLFMLYGLCFIYLGPPIGRLVDRAASTARYVVLAGALSGAALLVAARVPSFWGYAASVLLTGVAQCIVASSLLVYVLSLPKARELGPDRAASVFRLVERGGQVLGPVFFAAMAATAGLDHNLLLTGAAFSGAALLFALSARAAKAGSTSTSEK
jgi:predicted MFS family arabinose efflux permease